GGQLGAGGVELDRVVGQDRLVSELAFGRLVGRVGARHSVLGGLVQLSQTGVMLLQGLALLVDLTLRGLGLLVDHGHMLVHVLFGGAGAEAEGGGRQRQGRYRGFQSIHFLLSQGVPLPKLIRDHKTGRSWAGRRRLEAIAKAKAGPSLTSGLTSPLRRDR